MTSTEIRQGLNESRPSSKVAQPPGGQTNITLFGGPDAGPMPSRRSAEPVSSTPSIHEKRMPNQQKEKGPPQPIKPFQTYDPVTGAAYQYSSQGKVAASKEPPKPKEQNRPELQVGARVRQEGKTRVTQPPGGRSQITF
ncbi:uncharacterized protein [Apostichopus japonicus]|uniref:uncharacterized protein n=1 Tax=Stichopus japonicus TaxID=307972 RepID=UPI003AB38E5D